MPTSRNALDQPIHNATIGRLQTAAVARNFTVGTIRNADPADMLARLAAQMGRLATDVDTQPGPLLVPKLLGIAATATLWAQAYDEVRP
jgi:hypothetical protein